MNPEISAHELGIRIRKMRQNAGLKQSAFVGDLISSGYISLIEQGKRLPSPEVLNHIAQILGVTAAEILNAESSQSTDEQRALVAQAEALMAMRDFPSAAEVVAKFDHKTRKSRIARVIQAELDLALGYFLAGEMLCTDLIDDAVKARDWSITRRAVLAYSRISDRLNSTLESTIFLSELRRKLSKMPEVDDLLMAQITASLADRFLHLGDESSALKLLSHLDELLPKVSDLRARGSALWVRTTAAYETGDFEQAILLAQEAQSLFTSTADDFAPKVLQIKRLQIILRCLPDEDPRVLEAFEELELALSESENVKHVLVSHLRQIKTDYQFKLGMYDAAEDGYLMLLSNSEDEIEITAQNLCQLGRIKALRANISQAEELFTRSWSLLRAIELVPTVRRQLLQLAECFESVGNNDLALDVLKSMHKPVSDLSLLVKD
ncbi:MAG: helix-turn-helix domain-containing protein [Actinomycetales bacterium]|nr:helix-turn-helix domain-containing protein [Actinomycetales bacterium]